VAIFEGASCRIVLDPVHVSALLRGREGGMPDDENPESKTLRKYIASHAGENVELELSTGRMIHGVLQVFEDYVKLQGIEGAFSLGHVVSIGPFLGTSRTLPKVPPR
jgi:hypothetical protein